MKRWFITLVILVQFISVNLFAQNDSPDEHSFHHNHLALFLGPTSNTHTGSDDFTLGLDYEFRFSHMEGMFGIGLFAENIFADHSETLYGMLGFVHPYGNTKFVLGGGIAMVPVEEDEHGTDEQGDETEPERLFRAGIGYDVHIGFLTLSPVLNIDLIGSHVSFVYGLSIGIGF